MFFRYRTSCYCVCQSFEERGRSFYCFLMIYVECFLWHAMIRICPEVAFEAPWGGFSVVYVCKEDFWFWLQIHASFCHGSKASVFPSNCWELGWHDLICHCWSKRLKCHQNYEIKTDQIELELCLHTLPLFSSSSPVLFSLVLILSPLLSSSPPLLHFSPSCGTDCSSLAEMIYWCQVVNLLSRICTCPVVCRGSAIPLHALSRKHKWIIYGALGSAENPLVWSKCHACSLLRFFPFSCCSPESLIW